MAMAKDSQNQNNSLEELKLAFIRLEDELKKVVRRVDSVQKSVDLLYEDRSILEDLQGSIQSFKEILLHNRHHVDSAVKDVKAEVIEQGIRVKESVEDNISGLVQNIEQKDNVVIIKEGIFKKFKRFLIRG
jgi:predicted  nucleic acid-binding Zn-ribbon protein